MERIIVDNLMKKFKIGFRKKRGTLSRFLSFFSGNEPKKVIWALKGVSFRIKSGEIVGIIGKNGSGKSTLLRLISGIYKQEKGFIKNYGKLVPIINLNAGMQGRLSMRDNIYLVGSLFGLSKREIARKFDLIVKFSDLKNFVDTKLYQFSEGMLQRLAFSIAIYSNPDILLLDEVFEIGDDEFKKKSAGKIKELVKNGASVILISHELWMIEKYCDRVIWMDDGKIIKDGDCKEVLKDYLKRREE